jgi:glycosyltransferase involved in cell wall biosynthesis
VHGPRVTIFTETFLPRVDGIVNTLKWSLRGLLDSGWEPMVVAPTGNTQALPGVKVIGAPSIVFPPYPEVRLGYPTPEVCRKIDAFHPDVIHLAGPVTNGFGGLKYAQARQLPVVSSYHTALPEYARLYGLGLIEEWAWTRLRNIHNSTAVTLCPSRRTIVDLSARGFQGLELWARGVDAGLFTPDARSASVRARLGADTHDILVMYVGRLAREKKLDRLAEALRRVNGLRAALVGDGPDRTRLEAVFNDLPATFPGMLHGTDLAAAYAAADIFAFPSDTDTFGNVVLEAMACGVPVVAAAVGGQVDLVTHDRTGLLFDPTDIGQFAAHLERYRDSPALRQRHATAGLRAARERDWQRQIQLLIHHYARAMAGPARRAVAAAAA